MNRSLAKVREEARQMYLTGDVTSCAEIAARLGVKPHTVGRWRKNENWDGMKLKVDRRAAELFVEKIATDKVALNVRHYRFWDLLLAKLTDSIKRQDQIDAAELSRIAAILERVQKGQRLAKGLGMASETEESLRAQFHTEIRQLIDTFIDAIKENIEDEETRDRIRRTILKAVPNDEGQGVGNRSAAFAQ